MPQPQPTPDDDTTVTALEPPAGGDDAGAAPTPPASPAAPAEAGAAAPAPQRVSPFAKDWDALQAQQKALGEEQSDIYRKRDAALAPFRAQQLRTAQQRMPQPPKLQEQEPFTPPSQEAMHGWVVAAGMLGALAGLAGRKSATTGLTAMAGMNKGLADGNLLAFNQNYKTWEANSKAVQENNRVALDRYNAVLKNQKLNMEQQSAEIEIIATQFQDPLMANTARQKNITQMAQILKLREGGQDKLEDNHEKIVARKEEMDKKMKVELAKNGLVADEDGNISIDKSPNSPIEQSAKAIAAYKLAPLSSVGGKGPLNRVIMSRVMEINPNYNAGNWTGIQSYQRTAGNQSARVENATNEVEQLLPQAIETSRNLPRGAYVKWNDLEQRYLQGTSDPAYNDFALANFSLINAYTRAMNPQGVPRIAERLEQKANGILSTATSQKAYEVQAARLWKEVQASNRAVSRTREGLGDPNRPSPIPPVGGAPGAAPAAPGAGAAGAGEPSEDEVKAWLEKHRGG
jgi:hypothetical protein